MAHLFFPVSVPRTGKEIYKPWLFVRPEAFDAKSYLADFADDTARKDLGKTTIAETFKVEADRPVTLFNLQTGNKIGLLKTGIFTPLGLAYDMYQDCHQCSGTDLAKVTLLNTGGFVASFAVDALLVTSDGLFVEATIPANIAIARGVNLLKKHLAKTDEEKGQENQ